MKTKKFTVLALAIILALSLGLYACDKNKPTDNPPAGDAVASIELPTTMTTSQFAEFTLTATPKNAAGEALTGKTIEWSVDKIDLLSVSQTGRIIALKTGDAVVTASCESISANCAVRINEASELPVLDLGALDTVPLLLGGEFTLTPRVLYNGDAQQGAEFTFESGDESVATVDDGGKIKAVAYGETDVIVTGSWRNAGAGLLSGKVKVLVHDGYAAGITGGDTVYTANLKIDELNVEFSDVLQLTAAISQMGSPVTPAAGSVKWTSEKPEIASVDDNGLVTALREGETKISYTYEKPDGAGTLSSSFKTVKVVFPEIDLTQDGEEVLVDRALRNGGKIAFAQNVFPTQGQTLSAAYDVTGSAASDLQYSNGAITDNIITGERVWLFRGESYAVKKSVIVASKVIETADDLFGIKSTETGKTNDYLGLQSYETVTPHTGSGGSTFREYGGYFVLNADIDISASSMASALYRPQCSSTFKGAESGDILAGYGFNGVFDGRGHTINGFKPHRGGIFGDVAKGAVIKNFALTNVVISSTGDGQANISVLSHAMGGATVSNVFIEVDDATKNSSSVVCDLMFTGNTFENLIIVSAMSNTASAAFARWVPNFGLLASNVHVASTGECENFVVANTIYTSANFGELGLSGVSFTDGLPAQKVDMSGFDGDLWLKDGLLPVIKSAVRFVGTEEFPQAPTAIEAGSTVTAPSGFMFEVTVADEYKDRLTVTGTSVSLSADNATEFTFTLVQKNALTGQADTPVTVTAAAKAGEQVTVSEQLDYGVKTDESGAGFTISNAQFTTVSRVSMKKKGTDGSVALSSDDWSQTGNALTIAKSYLETVDAADYEVQVVCGNKSFNYTNVTVATRAIGTWDEFKKMVSDDPVASGRYFANSGYYVLTNNIIPEEGQYNVMTAGTAKQFNTYLGGQTQYTDLGNKNTDYGFRGVFDGRGYTIDRVQLLTGSTNKPSVFGDIGNGGVVKNVAFTNFTASGSIYASLFYIASGATFENIFVHCLYNLSGNNPYGGLAYGISNTCSFENIVIYGKQYSSGTQLSRGLLAGDINKVNNTTTNPAINNVFCIAAENSATKVVVGTNNNSTDVSAVVLAEYDGSAFVGETPDFTALSDAFDKTSAFVPVLKSTAALIASGSVNLDTFIG